MSKTNLKDSFEISNGYGQWSLTVLESLGEEGFRRTNKVFNLFQTSQVPKCCAVEEMGVFYDPLTPEQRNGAVKAFLRLRGEQAEAAKKGQPQSSQGLVLAHFVKHKGSKVFQSEGWMETLLENGFTQVIPDFENPVHPGNVIRQLMYINAKHIPKETKNDKTDPV